MTYECIYIIDYYRRTFLYVSENPLFLCGLRATEVEKMGYSFYLKYVPQEDLERLVEINTAGFNFFNTIPITSRMNYDISYDFRLKQNNNKLLMVNHKLKPLELDRSGNIWLALCVVSISSSLTTGNVFIKEQVSNSKYSYDFISKNWSQLDSLRLSKTEQQVLLCSSMGLTSDEIAERLFLSKNTIKFHRKRIFKKLNVTNIAEALTYATNHKLI